MMLSLLHGYWLFIFCSGGFMLIRSPNGTFEYIDFRETAPKASTHDMFVENPLLAAIGPLSVAVPWVFFLVFVIIRFINFCYLVCSGEIRGLELAHKR